MALPKTYKSNSYYYPQREDSMYPNQMFSGAVKNLVEKVEENHTFFPKGIMYEDLDVGFKDFIQNNIVKNVLTNDDNKVEVKLLMGINRMNEYLQTWGDSDEFKNIKFPLVIATRTPISESGAEPQGMGYNIPKGRLYPYHYEVTNDGNKKIIDVYSIPQPIPVNLTYEMKIFCYFIEDLNKIQINVMKEFQSRQAYMLINGHYITILLDDISDETNFEEYEEKRFYSQTISFTVNGFIMDPNDFKKTTSYMRANISI